MAWTRNKKGTGSEFGQSKDVRFAKQCLECGQTYHKYVCSSKKRWEMSKFCSTVCKGTYMHRTQICGKDFQVGHEMPTKGTAKTVPCRGCGKPIVACHGVRHCGELECRAKSKEIRYRRIGQALAAKSSPRGEGELMLEPHLLERGWLIQHPVTVNGRTFRLDFARPEQKLYVEVDGVSHHLRRQSDAERTRLLTEDGWMGLRFWNSEIRDNLQDVLKAVWN